jgi:hypothetical protein
MLCFPELLLAPVRAAANWHVVPSEGRCPSRSPEYLIKEIVPSRIILRYSWNKLMIVW